MRLTNLHGSQSPEAASSLLPAGSNAASSLGFLMVVSRMLTRHQHEPRARLRSATSGTMKRKGAAAGTARQTSIPKCSIHGSFCGFAFFLNIFIVSRIPPTFSILPSFLPSTSRVDAWRNPPTNVRASKFRVLEKVDLKLWTGPLFCPRGNWNRTMSSISAASSFQREGEREFLEI